MEAALLGEEQKAGVWGQSGVQCYISDDELVSKCDTIAILPASYPSLSFSCVPATMTSEPTRALELSEKGSPYEEASSTPNDNSNDNSNSDNNSNTNEKSTAVVKSQDEQDEASSTSVSEVFDVKQFDPVLARKMALVNQAIDEIGMTSFQWNLFWLNGFGYTVDSVWSSISPRCSLNYHDSVVN